MANPADSYDPLMMLRVNSSMGGGTGGVPTGPTEPERFPAALERFDGTENMRAAGADVRPVVTNLTPGGNTPRWPSGVNNFDPINLIPGPQHPDAPKQKFENAGTGEG